MRKAVSAKPSPFEAVFDLAHIAPDVLTRANQRKSFHLYTSLLKFANDPPGLMRQAEKMDAEVESLSWFQIITRKMTPKMSGLAQLNACIHAELRCARVALAA